ncbi:haloacid dehalogenase superfamily, subfamily IA, variant 3 with third motif having DD or ED [Anaerolinea thermolimosa]|uniref:HAD family hydrolase n=1 Tax=Anaerolinea thermolimosa TaxID=229919 RepID=UPI000780DEEF|nr:HAD family phosphatase [Anaerolinea thermolimosa]GAP06085.1 haloacid dehalogenase superfamily, subfamily IA, variant 3 with third motif having DD or ED [Anaerolinea thermolimosa]
MGIRAVILDIDGLMIDSERVSQRSWSEVMRRAGYELTEEVYLQMIGRTEKDVKQILTSVYGEAFPFERMYHEREETFLRILEMEGIPVKAGLFELLDWVESRKLKMAVATSTYGKLAERKLMAAGIRERFQVIVSGDEVDHGKPAPDLFLGAARRIGVNAPECVVLEDSQAGIQAAYAAGMKAILVPDMQPLDEQIARLAYRVVPSLREAIPILEELS